MSSTACPPAVPTWDDLAEMHEARIHRLAYRLSGNRADAEDLTQEVLFRAFRALEGFQPGNVDAWLQRITTNLFLDQVRRRARVRIEPLRPATADKLTARTPGPDQQLLEGVFDADIESALAALKPEYRAPVLLCDVDGLTYEEVADVLGLKLGTVRSRIHRGRNQLRRALGHRAPRRPSHP